MKIKKFQQGGMAPEAVPASVPASEQDPMTQLVEMAMAALEGQDPNLAMQVCQMLLELVGATQAPAQQPVFKKGGKLIRK